MNNRNERIEKLINKHKRTYIGLYANKNLRICLNTIFYDRCIVHFSEIMDEYYIDFYVNNRIISSISLKNIDYDMLNHELYVK